MTSTDYGVCSKCSAPLFISATPHVCCEGCRRHALDPKWTLRFWSRDDPDDPVPGRWMHVDPSGSTYDCTAPDARVPEDDDAE